jgi:hypothetical protein
MQEANFDHNHFASGQQREADKGLLVKFYIEPKKNNHKSKLEGRDIYQDTEFVDIKIPGNRNAGACRPATQEDKNRFPDHYKAFKDRTGDNAVMVGSPLKEWAPISRSQAEELAFFHVHTVEQLATMSDVQASKFMGLTTLRQKAKQWLENAEKEKPFAEMEIKLKERDVKIDQLQEAVNTLIEQLNSDDSALNANQKKRKVTRAKKSAEKAM